CQVDIVRGICGCKQKDSLLTGAVMDKDQAYAELIRRAKEHALLNSCASVLGWDERTYMPRQGSAHRAEQLALLARLGHEMLTTPRIGELLAEVADHPQVKLKDSHHAANVREI